VASSISSHGKIFGAASGSSHIKIFDCNPMIFTYKDFLGQPQYLHMEKIFGAASESSHIKIFDCNPMIFTYKDFWGSLSIFTGKHFWDSLRIFTYKYFWWQLQYLHIERILVAASVSSHRKIVGGSIRIFE